MPKLAKLTFLLRIFFNFCKINLFSQTMYYITAKGNAKIMKNKKVTAKNVFSLCYIQRALCDAAVAAAVALTPSLSHFLGNSKSCLSGSNTLVMIFNSVHSN